MSNATAIVCTENQEISLEDITLPELRPNDVLVKNLYSGVSIGTELLLIQNKINWGPFPIIPGYQAVGIIEAVGSDVNQLKVNDRVYHRGYFPSDRHEPIKNDGIIVSATSGAHSSHTVVNLNHKEHSAAILPEGIDEVSASLFVVASVGLFGVDMAGVGTGDTVAVLGTGLIGLGNVAAAKLRGAKVIAIDLDQLRLDVAAKLGADHIVNAGRQDTKEAVRAIVPDGADVVFEASGNRGCIDIAMSLCRKFGKFVFQGNYGGGPLPFEFYIAHVNRLTAYFPCDDGHEPYRETIMDWIGSGALKWDQTITHQIDAADAAEFYNDINTKGIKGVLGAVIKW